MRKNGDILPACIEVLFWELVSLHSAKCPGTIYFKITPHCDGWRAFRVPVSVWLCWVSWLDMKEFIFFRSGLNNCSEIFNSSWAAWGSARCFAPPKGKCSPPGRRIPVHGAVLVWIDPIFFLLWVWRVLSGLWGSFDCFRNDCLLVYTSSLACLPMPGPKSCH